MTEPYSQADIQAAVAEARRAIAANWGWLMGLGIILLLAGAAAIGFSHGAFHAAGDPIRV